MFKISKGSQGFYVVSVLGSQLGENCDSDAECPVNSECIHEEGDYYCKKVCVCKPSYVPNNGPHSCRGICERRKCLS